MIVLEITFWMAFNLMAYSYIVYPFITSVWAYFSTSNFLLHPSPENCEGVSIVMAVYNEEKVIAHKIESVFQTNFSLEKIELLIGSDNSTDKTNEIIKKYTNLYPQIQFYSFQQRQGKSNILNQLIPNAKFPILILTDANVLFSTSLIFQLSRYFKDEKIGQVGANIINKGEKMEGIATQEKAYVQREIKIKYEEGKAWGCSMGAFGACYAVRKNLFSIIPQGFLMEDFYISMNVLNKNFKAITALDAIAYEDVSEDWREEYKRKLRISAGNFQNLSVYKHFLMNVFTQPGFSFFSHKFIRWIGPILILIMLAASIVLAMHNTFYTLILLIFILALLLMFLDPLMNKAGIHIKPIRFISYFCWMNVALFSGFLKYLKGIQTNVWQPTKRNT